MDITRAASGLYVNRGVGTIYRRGEYIALRKSLLSGLFPVLKFPCAPIEPKFYLHVRGPATASRCADYMHFLLMNQTNL
jgi:hypothetical protein